MSASLETKDNTTSVPSEEPIKKLENNETKSSDVVDRVAVEDKAIPSVENGDLKLKNGAENHETVDDVKKAGSDAVNSEDGVEELVNGERNVKHASDVSDMKTTSETGDMKNPTEKSDLEEKSPSMAADAEKPAEKSDVAKEPVANVAVAEKSNADEKPATNDSDVEKLAEKSGAEVKPAANDTDAEKAVEKSVVENKPAEEKVIDAKKADEKSDVEKVAEKSDVDETEPAKNVSDAEKPVEKSEVAEKSASSDVEVANPEKPVARSSNEEESGETASAAASDTDLRKEGADEIFTDAMIEKIEKNYNPTDEDAVNLLETPDDEMFCSETKAVVTNGDAIADAATESTKEETEKSDASEAVNLLLQGKRNMLVKDYESAVSILGDACQKFASVYGDLGVECAEVYMAYGQALLELWRVEDANKKNGGDADETKALDVVEDDDEDDDDGGDDQTKENGGVAAEADDAKDALAKAADESMDVDGDDKNDATETPDGVADESNAEGENQTENNDEDEEVESEEDVDNLQVAWEILELAKKIYEKTSDDANLARVHSRLGEISIASANFAYAIDDLKRSLELLAQSASVDVRHKANIHFQLYIAHSMKCNFPEAEAELRVAKSTFESHLRDLERRLESADKSKTGELDAISAEIKEIKEVIQDMNSKMVETHKEKRELISAISEVIKTKNPVSEETPAVAAAATSSSSSLSDGPSSSPADAFSKFSPLKSDVPVNNISHLVRKKPKVVGDEPKADEKKVEKSTGELSNGSTADACKENGVESVCVVGESDNSVDANPESSKRKADEDLENNAKKFCA